MSAASPENQQQIQLTSEAIIHKVVAPSSPPELATMTNVVNVLDLHKGDFPNETKIYDKNTNTVYVYSNAPTSTTKIDDATIVTTSSSGATNSPESLHHSQHLHHHHHHHQQLSPDNMHQVVINQHPSDLSIDNALKDEHFELMQEQNGVMLQRIVNDGNAAGGEQQILTKISANDDSLFRLIETNQLVSKLVGENQQIISRDIINGEHHIITRNENGEHILTRIVNTSAIDHGNGKMHNSELFNALGGNANAGSTTPNGAKVIDDGKTTQIIYTTHDGATNGQSVIKSQQPYDNLNPDVQKQIDLIYEDGNKTVIYTTGGTTSNPNSPHDDDEPKGLELFSSTGECLNGTQVIVQGNLQYTPQIQPDGTTVYVVSELVGDLNEQG
jgi:transcription factor CP2-like protein